VLFGVNGFGVDVGVIDPGLIKSQFSETPAQAASSQRASASTG